MNAIYARSGWVHALRSIALVALLGFIYVAPVPVRSEPGTPAQRAEFIVGILRFVHWGEDVTQEQTLSICIFGKPASAEGLLALDGQVLWKDIKARVEKRSVRDADTCDVAVSGRLKTKFFRVLVSRAENHQVLTICDVCTRRTVRFAMMNIVEQRDKLRFRANVTQIREAGLSLDASLLELASENDP